jgi:hypothetical protein
MTCQADQEQVQPSSQEAIQEVNEEELENVSGGGITLSTPSQLRRTQSAPGRLQNPDDHNVTRSASSTSLASSNDAANLTKSPDSNHSPNSNYSPNGAMERWLHLPPDLARQFPGS